MGRESRKSRVKLGREFSENCFGLMLTIQTNVIKRSFILGSLLSLGRKSRINRVKYGRVRY